MFPFNHLSPGLIRSPTHLVLFFQNFARVWFLVGHVNALEAVDVLGKTGLGDVGLPGLDGLHQGVVYEDVLLLSLYEAVALFPDVLEVGEDVEVSPGDDLLQHGVDDDVAASPPDPRTRDGPLVQQCRDKVDKIVFPRNKMRPKWLYQL